jgi:poly(3-hydroxybutyrate) depolymerase
MQPKRYSKIIVLVFCLIWVAASPAKGEDPCVDGIQASGSIYRICMPPDGIAYNGKLVIWAHGFQDATDPVHIPEYQLTFGDFSIQDVITSLGYAFATNSYSKTGLAVLKGANDIVGLVDIFYEYATDKRIAQPEKVFVTGASQGGLITALLIETYPDLFDAGLAACGPVGDFPYQLKNIYL